MTREYAKFGKGILALAVAFTAVSMAQAATINVPADHATIQAAIDAAAAGDTILVAPGVYDQGVASLNINKANLIVQSTGGAGATRIELNDMTMPVVKITEPGCTLDGFWIRQLGSGVQAGHSGGCVRLEPDGVSPPLGTGPTTLPTRPITTVQNCIISGDETGEGIVTYSPGNSALVYAHIRILNNQFVRHGAGTYSFMDAIHFHHQDPDAGGDFNDISAGDCLIEIFNNEMQEIDRGGVYFHDDIVRTKVDMGGNSSTHVNSGTTDYGYYFNDDIESFSSVNVVECEVLDAEYGFYASGGVYYRSHLKVENCNFSNIRDYVIYANYFEDGSSATVTGNTMSGDGTAYYGIYMDVEYASWATVDGNEITGVDEYGMYIYSYYGSSVMVTNNVVIGAAGCSYGIYTDTEYGSDMTVNNNDIAEFEYAGLYEDYPYGGSTYTARDNTMHADPAGADYGIYMYGPEYGSIATLANNVATEFDTYGIYVDYVYDGGDCTIVGNTLAGLDGDYGIYVYYVYEGSQCLVEGNTCSSLDYAGFYNDYVYYGSQLTVQNNNFTGSAAGMSYGMYFDEVYNNSHVFVRNNTCSNFDDTGLYFYWNYETSIVEIANNVLNGLSTGATYGIYFDYPGYEGGAVSITGNTATNFDDTGLYIYDMEYGAICNVDNNTFTSHPDGCYYGFYLDYVYYGSSLFMNNNTFTGHGNQGGGEYGVYHGDEIYEGSIWTMTNSTFTSHEAGCDYGLYSDDGFDYGCIGIFDNNTFTGYTDTGFYTYYTEDGSDVAITNNVFTALPGGSDYGIYFDDGAAYGSNITCSNNQVSRFTDTGIWCYELYEGSTGIFNNNQLIGEGAGATYGFYMDDYVDYGSYCEVSGNNIQNIKDDATEAAAIYFADYIDDGSECLISNNVCRGLPDTDTNDSGIYMYYTAEYGATLTISGNDVEDFSETCIKLYDTFYYGAECLITGNRMAGGMYGIWTDGYGAEDGCVVTISRNDINGFTEHGILWYDVITSNLNILENSIVGGGTEAGIEIEDDISAAARVEIAGNCFQNVPTGIILEQIFDSSVAKIYDNDFSGVTTLGVRGEFASAINPVDARNNFFGALAQKAFGEVLTTPTLGAAPDSDGDGVSNCADACSDTAAGQNVDANGCPAAEPEEPEEPVTPSPCGVCGAGAVGFMPLSILGLAMMRRRTSGRRSR